MPGDLYPPDTPSSTVGPMTMADCEGDGWTNFPQFDTQQECFDFVEGLTS